MCIGTLIFDTFVIGERVAVPRAVDVGEALDQRLVRDRAALAQEVEHAVELAVGVVERALRSQDARKQAAEDVVRGTDPAGPRQREAVVAHAAGIDERRGTTSSMSPDSDAAFRCVGCVSAIMKPVMPPYE